MARKKGTKHSPAFKAQVALAALKGDRTVNQLAAQYKVHPNLIYKWKAALLHNAQRVFADGAKAPDQQQQDLLAELYQQIGRLDMELAWLKKKHDTLG
jgi:transposase-like protein